MLLMDKIFTVSINEKEVKMIVKALEENITILKEKAGKMNQKNQSEYINYLEVKNSIEELKKYRNQFANYINITYYGD